MDERPATQPTHEADRKANTINAKKATRGARVMLTFNPVFGSIHGTESAAFEERFKSAQRPSNRGGEGGTSAVAFVP